MAGSWMEFLTEKVSHCIIFGCSWTAWILSVISLASYNWVAVNIGSINGPYTFGLFMERATCSLCQPLLNPPPFVHATRCFMISGCICGFAACASDILVVLFQEGRPFKILCAISLCCADCFTLVGVSVFSSQRSDLTNRATEMMPSATTMSGQGDTVMSGYGVILAWSTFALYSVAVPLVIYEAWYRPPRTQPCVPVTRHSSESSSRKSSETPHSQGEVSVNAAPSQSHGYTSPRHPKHPFRLSPIPSPSREPCDDARDSGLKTGFPESLATSKPSIHPELPDIFGPKHAAVLPPIEQKQKPKHKKKGRNNVQSSFKTTAM